MTTVTVPASGATAASFIVDEEIYRSREEGVIAAGAGKLKNGTILGQITASAKYVGYAPGATNGSEVASAVLYEDVDATAQDVKRTIIVREAQLHRAELFFVGTPTQPQKDAAYASLAKAHIVMR